MGASHTSLLPAKASTITSANPATVGDEKNLAQWDGDFEGILEPHHQLHGKQ